MARVHEVQISSNFTFPKEVVTNIAITTNALSLKCASPKNATSSEIHSFLKDPNRASCYADSESVLVKRSPAHNTVFVHRTLDENQTII